MSKLSREELQQIIDSNMPGHKLVEGTGDDDDPATDDAASAEVQVEGNTPDISRLRHKYLREKYLADDRGSLEADGSSSSENPGANDDDVDIVLVESKNSSDPLDRRTQVKAVLIDTKTKKIIGAQG